MPRDRSYAYLMPIFAVGALVVMVTAAFYRAYPVKQIVLEQRADLRILAEGLPELRGLHLFGHHLPTDYGLLLGPADIEFWVDTSKDGMTLVINPIELADVDVGVSWSGRCGRLRESRRHLPAQELVLGATCVVPAGTPPTEAYPPIVVTATDNEGIVLVKREIRFSLVRNGWQIASPHTL
jgi:hypothetical protein